MNKNKMLFTLGVSVLSSAALAQSYSVGWHTIAGGGTSTGGIYSISGTIGQPDAGATMTGGAYSLAGGFWALPISAEDPDAPTLSIVPAGSGQARISWAPDTPGFLLQERVSPSAGGWANSPSGQDNPALVPTTIPARFYRLFKP